MQEKVKENPYIKLIIDTDQDILYGYYKNNVRIGLEEAKKIVEDRLALTEGKSYLALVTMEQETGYIRYVTKEARDYFANEGCHGLIALAIWTHSWVNKMLGNFYITFSNPLIPVKLFHNYETALDWLKNIKDNADIKS